MLTEVTQTSTTPEANKNAVTLSSGVKVIFKKKLPPAIGQRLVVSAFNDANITAEGRVRSNISTTEQLQLAQKMFNYNAALILNGLYWDCLELDGGLPENTRWLSLLKANPMIKENHPDIDFSDEIHKIFMFLFYFGFSNDEDLGILSSNLLET